MTADLLTDLLTDLLRKVSGPPGKATGRPEALEAQEAEAPALRADARGMGVDSDGSDRAGGRQTEWPDDETWELARQDAGCHDHAELAVDAWDDFNVRADRVWQRRREMFGDDVVAPSPCSITGRPWSKPELKACGRKVRVLSNAEEAAVYRNLGFQVPLLLLRDSEPQPEPEPSPTEKLAAKTVHPWRKPSKPTSRPKPERTEAGTSGTFKQRLISDAELDRVKVDYDDGESMSSIASAHFEKWGYGSADSLQVVLYKAFKRRGWPRRPRGGSKPRMKEAA